MLGGAASSRSMENISVRIFEGMTTESYWRQLAIVIGGEGLAYLDEIKT